jgi:protein-S-isoprenylcysteine O-methyltransferase Ste14
MNDTADNIGHGGGGIRIHPPLLAAALLAAGLLLHLLGVHHHPHHPVHIHQLIGLLVVGTGVGLSAYAAATFSARNTTLNPYGQPGVFVTTGPFAFTRNPMYLGITALLLGFAVFFWSPVMVLAPIIFFLVMDRMIIPGEEETMERCFGISYQDYQRRARRWL